MNQPTPTPGAMPVITTPDCPWLSPMEPIKIRKGEKFTLADYAILDKVRPQ